MWVVVDIVVDYTWVGKVASHGSTGMVSLLTFYKDWICSGQWWCLCGWFVWVGGTLWDAWIIKFLMLRVVIVVAVVVAVHSTWAGWVSTRIDICCVG